MFVRLAVFLALLVANVSAQQKRYDGSKVFRLVPHTLDQLNFVQQFLDAPSDQFDFWTEPSMAGNPVDLRVSAESVNMFTGLAKVTGISYEELIPDVQQYIDSVQNQDNIRRVRKLRTSSIVGTFPTHNATNDWLLSLCASNPMATCGDVGQSYEKRTIKYIKLGNPSQSNAVKQKIWIEGTMHAREWLSTATVIYVINRLLTTYETDPIAKRMLDDYDWYIIPISNPDGYEYSRNKERLWRKTRSKSSTLCYGADPNRNWGFRWGKGGSSTQPCSDTYQGSKAFSEVETLAISNFITANKDNTHVYFSFHTYAQFWLIPYGITPKPDDFDELLRVAKIGAEALQAVNKQKWEVGNIIDLLYAAAGGSIDWVKGTAGIKYSYCLELRPGRGSLNGFVVSEKEIDPSGREVWAALTAAIDAIPN